MNNVRAGILHALSHELSQSLSRFGRDSEGVVLTSRQPEKLKQQVERLAVLFEQGAPPTPPLQLRLQALARLRRGAPDLSSREWILISWGLADDCGAHGKPMDEQPLFEAVMSYTDAWLARRDVPRKGWFGLLNSYFSYEPEQSSSPNNWLRLRGRLVHTMPILLSAQSRPKLWSRLLEQHADLLTDDAGRSLRQILFSGSVEEQDHLKNGLPIPEAGWLWRRIIAHQISYLNGLNDPEFNAAIIPMVEFLRSKALYADDILAALLTRYCQSGKRDETHELLKSESFSRWGNPQLRGAARWSKVEKPVRAMVMRWFAKEDLEHFFSLLQGTGGVDQARLEYWLRFVDQISYTRILLGSDAVSNPHPEFQNFRKKYAKRYGHLTGGVSSNNGFIMRINDHYFVEFSGTGNACYAYEEKQLPFDPDARVLSANSELKKKIGNAYVGNNVISHHRGWQRRADEFLRQRGISAGVTATAIHSAVQNYQPSFRVSSGGTPASTRVSSPPVLAEPVATRPPAQQRGAASLWPTTIDGTVGIAKEMASLHGVRVQDNRDKGGAFWVLTTSPGSPLGLKLTQLGMRFNRDKGFWIE